MLGAYLSRWEIPLLLETDYYSDRLEGTQQPYNIHLSILGAMSVKVTINEDECTACGLCYNDECPEIFEEGSDGNSNLKKEFQRGGIDKGEIPDDKKACAQAGAEACPVNAIVVG